MFLTGVLCYITGIFILKERIWDMKENTALRKRILAALFLAIGLILPFNADTDSRENALPDAHTGVIMWIYLRMAIWLAYWDYYTSFKRSVVRNAGNFSECLLYGV